MRRSDGAPTWQQKNPYFGISRKTNPRTKCAMCGRKIRAKHETSVNSGLFYCYRCSKFRSGLS